MKKIVIALVFTIIFIQTAMGGVCDYRPSKLIGEKTTGVVAGGTGVVAATGMGLKAAGIYTITNATTGATMLGSTTAGASAAGTTGIIAGTGGVLGSIGADINVSICRYSCCCCCCWCGCV